MATQLAPHPVAWAPPRPLWWGGEPGVRAPQILRFASDDFMDQLLATLAEEPARLGERIARPETWRTPAADLAATDLVQRVPIPAPAAHAKRIRLLAQPGYSALAPAPAEPLKLYQPAHQRYYLVAASLACRLPGLPERTLAGPQERIGFVLRRLLPATGSASDKSQVEYAHLAGEEPRWQRVGDDPATLAPGEELLPLFPLAHRDDTGKPRTLWAGLIPVGRREAYLGESIERTAVPLATGQLNALRPGAPAPKPLSKQARTATFQTDVAEPWKAMIRAATKAQAEASDGDTPSDDQRARRILDYDLQFQMQSWLVLLDMADWLAAELPKLGAAVGTNSTTGLTAPEANALAWLNSANAAVFELPMRSPRTATTNLKPLASSLRDALARVATPANRALIENATTHYAFAAATGSPAQWPDFHFPLAGLDTGSIAQATLGDQTKLGAAEDVPVIAQPAAIPPGASDTAALVIDKVTALFARLLVATDEADKRPMPFALKLSRTIAATAGDDGLFVIRMVHLNADCGPLHPPTLSEPTARFRLASFFDSDAPVRPIRITLPSDTTPAGLRKHGRGTAFVMSDLLCGQVQRAKGLGFVDLVRQVLPWPLHKDIDIGSGSGCKDGGGAEIGMICSLSIPIITLCALILLMIIVFLLDFIFRWVPWFIACFPVPGLKGKQA